ncbi:MAG: hypothetical protein Q9M28_07280, partial [Mariprofundaceae bacterium]|nr:hypothetical protein [Mariprofundaceae bacterium]
FSKPLIERSFLNLLSFIGHLNQFNSLRKNLFGNVTSKGIYRLAGSADHFTRVHWTTGKVPAVAMGVIKEALSLENILTLRLC